MKRIIPLFLSVVLAVALLAGTSAFAADYDDEYVFDYTKVPVDGQQVSHDPYSNYGYATITSTDPATSPFFILQSIEVPNTQKYVAIKYSTESVFSDGEHITNSYMWVTAGDDDNPKLLDWDRPDECTGDPKLIADGEWHLSIIEIASTFSGVGDYNITTFRLPGAAAGEIFNIAYVGFFTTEEEALAFDADYSYDYDLPSESGGEPSAEPSDDPTDEPTAEPTAEPTEAPTEEPADEPTPTRTPIPTPVATPKSDTAAPESEDSGNMTWIIIAVVALVAAAAAAVILVIKKKGKK